MVLCTETGHASCPQALDRLVGEKDKQSITVWLVSDKIGKVGTGVLNTQRSTSNPHWSDQGELPKKT